MTITSLWNISSSPAPTGTSTASPNADPSTLNPATFATWSYDDQVAYIKLMGTGFPPSVNIGPSDDPVTFTYDAASQTVLVDTSTLPATAIESGALTPTTAEFNTSPDLLDAKTFLTWSKAEQVAYIQKWAAATDTVAPRTIAIGPAAQSITFGVDLSGNVTINPPIPYQYLNGSTSGTPSAVVSASAEALYPTIDGVTHTLPASEAPANFSVNVNTLDDAGKLAFLQDFATWNSSYQLQYIKIYGTGGDATTKAGNVLDVKVISPSATEMTAVVSLTDPTKFYIVQALDKDTIAKMSLIDQTKIAGLTAFTDIAASLGLSVAASTTMNSLVNTNATVPLLSSGGTVGFIDELKNHIDGTDLSQDAKDAFDLELRILSEQLANSTIVSAADIQKKASDINDRFTRMLAFWDVVAPVPHNEAMGKPDATITVYTGVVSQDGDLSGIQHGYQVFLAQEQQIANLANERMQLVRDNGIFLGKHLDVPMLVYKFQSNYSDSLDAEVTADTEEVNQQNALLKTYAQIQDIINKTLSAFTKADDGSKVLYGATDDQTDTGNSVDYTNKLSSSDMHILSMFEDLLGAPGGNYEGSPTGQLSPMEKILGISRPLFDFFRQNPGEDSNYDLNSYSQPQWSTYGTRLSETVTLINQNSQIQMNDINSLSKEKDRHFDLANNALSKMADIIENIARID